MRHKELEMTSFLKKVIELGFIYLPDLANLYPLELTFQGAKRYICGSYAIQTENSM